MKRILISYFLQIKYFPFWVLLCVNTIEAQTVFHTKDIENFYEAFDSVQTTSDKLKQTEFVQRIYIEKGSLGLKYAIKNSLDGGKIATANHWSEMMLNSKENLIRIRPFLKNLPDQMLILKTNSNISKNNIQNLKMGMYILSLV